MGSVDLYLDVDGGILRRTGRAEFGGREEFEVAPGATAFLTWAIENFNCFWLTSRSHDGTHDGIDRAFRLSAPVDTHPCEIKGLVRAICPAPWGREKVSGIDLSRDFYWVDDNPDDGSIAILEQSVLSSRLLIASTDRSPDDLERVKKHLVGEFVARCVAGDGVDG